MPPVGTEMCAASPARKTRPRLKASTHPGVGCHMPVLVMRMGTSSPAPTASWMRAIVWASGSGLLSGVESWQRQRVTPFRGWNTIMPLGVALYSNPPFRPSTYLDRSASKMTSCA